MEECKPFNFYKIHPYEIYSKMFQYDNGAPIVWYMTYQGEKTNLAFRSREDIEELIEFVGQRYPDFVGDYGIYPHFWVCSSCPETVNVKETIKANGIIIFDDWK